MLDIITHTAVDNIIKTPIMDGMLMTFVGIFFAGLIMCGLATILTPSSNLKNTQNIINDSNLSQEIWEQDWLYWIVWSVAKTFNFI